MNEQKPENMAQEPIVTDQEVKNNEQELKETADEISSESSDTAAKLTPEDELAEMKDKYLRMYSEFENYKRRVSRERVELFKTANQEILQALLPILDDFERAMKSMEKATEVSAVMEGIQLIQNKLKNTCTQKGLKEMEAMEQAFDPDFHEAITNIPAPTEALKGKVLDVVEKGYFLNDKVIRYAKVVVGE